MPENATSAQVAPTSVSKSTKNFSELQLARLNHVPALPEVLLGHYKAVVGPATTSAGNSDEIAKLFPSLYGQPSIALVPGENSDSSAKSLRIGVVLSGGQAPGGHNVIAGLFDFLQRNAPGSVLIGFKGGPAGIMKNKTVEITAGFLYPYRNQGGFDIICSGRDKIETPEQFSQAESTCQALDLDGLVVIGGDDSNTNACLLAEYFRSRGLKTSVIGCPKTIDGDLKSSQVPISFGFDTACKIYSEMIGNVMMDARSTGKYYHFIRLMGRSASHITLECALQTHPTVALIGEEVDQKAQTLKEITSYLADVVCERANRGVNYGVFLIPEGIIEFVPEVHHLVSELNEILAKSDADAEGLWKSQLSPSQRELFDSLPVGIQRELLLERDPHGNVQVARIQSEKLLISMVETELHGRSAQGKYEGKFRGQAHFCGYEGRCGMPSNFDSSYCYSLGFAAGALLKLGQTGLIASVGNLTAPQNEWTVGGTALTSLMDIERRKGKNKPVIKKALVELEGAPFKLFSSLREEWSLGDYFVSPGPIQFSGPTSNDITFTLKLETDGEI